MFDPDHHSISRKTREADGKLLTGKVFISTRPSGKSQELEECLKAQGATLIEMPMIEIYPVRLTRQDKELIKNVNRFDWILFTSPNGILHFFEHLREITGSCTLNEKTKIAVIGNKTAFALRSYGFKPHYINKGSSSDDLAAGLVDIIKSGNPKILLPVGNLAHPVLENKLGDMADICRIHVYETRMPAIVSSAVMQGILDNRYEMILFTSPSGIHNFLIAIQDKISPGSLRIACIGKSSADAAVESGFSPVVIANTMNSESIVNTILDFYKSGNPVQ